MNTDPIALAGAGVSAAATVGQIFPGPSELASLMRKHDWGKTAIGVPEKWPATWRTAVSLCLTSRIPVVLYLGEEFTVLYNDAYISFLGPTKHPYYLGRPCQECWKELWPTIGPMLRSVYATATATWSEDMLLFFARALPLEEVYIRFTFGPILREDGRIVDGIFCPCTETTQQVIGARRLETLRKLGVQATESTTIQDACLRAASVLDECPEDIPFAAVYLADSSHQRLNLIAHCGVGDSTVALPSSVSLSESDDSLWALGPVAQTRTAREVLDLPSRGLLLPGRPYPEPASHAIVLPIEGSSAERLSGVLLAGTSPRMPLDDSYRTFLGLVAGHIGKAIGDAYAYELERRRVEELSELDCAKTAFFSNVSHEFRTPLTLMLGPVDEAIGHADTPDSVRPLLEVARRNSLRLLKLVNSLLDFSRLEVGRQKAYFEPTDLATLTCDLASIFRSAIERAGLQYTVECDSLQELVYVDPSMWEKVILNLLSNALKFTLSGTITVRLRQEGSSAVLEVADTGIGIAEKDLPHMFERFYRVEGTAGRSHEGSGIGLSLVKELARLHGGTVSVASQPGRGSSFQVRLPLGSAHLPPESVKLSGSPGRIGESAGTFLLEASGWVPEVADAATAGGQPSGGSIAEPAHAASAAVPARIVLADDNADMRGYLHGLLSAVYEVEVTSNGEEALAAARRRRPDLIVTDVMMPRMDGFALMKAVRGDPQIRDIPIIMVSARAGEEARIEGLEQGVDDYLIKPFTARELMARVSATLNLAQLRQRFERELSSDVESLRILCEVGNHCIRAGDQYERCLDVILDAAIALTKADKGNIQVFNGNSNVLEIAVHRGFERPFLKFFATVRAGESAASGRAMQCGDRVVLEDITHSTVFVEQSSLEVLLDAGVRALQSTPLTSSSGLTLGVISTHYAVPHRPTERELQRMELLARLAADYLERKRHESELEARALQVESLLEASPQGVFLIDENLQIRAANPCARRSFASGLVGTSFEAVLQRLRPESCAPEIVGALRRAIETGEPCMGRQPVELALEEVHPTHHEWQVNRVSFPEGGRGGVCYFRDVTLHVESQRDLQFADRQKNEFLAMLAHELRNPLAPIRNATELLSRASDAEPAHQFATSVLERQVTHLTRLVDDLMDISRITQGRIELRRRSIKLSEIVAQAVESVGPLLKERQHKIEVRSDETTRVSADAIRLVQCLANILTNAAKYTESGGQLSVHCYEEGGEAVIAVADNGSGISPDLLPRVFDLFVQSDRTLDRAQGGLGIGLAVVKRLIEMHGGGVSASSPGLGKGATFEIRLPKVVSSDDDSVEEAARSQVVPRRVLVVDDNVDAAESLEMLLRLEGHHTACAYAPAQALERARSFQPEIVLLDIGLPHTDGYQLARWLRDSAHLQRVHLVAVTGYGRAEDRARAKAAGFDDHLTKPIAFEDLRRILAGNSAAHTPPRR